MIGFNKQQRQAVEAPLGPTLLLAVPGSGKTTVLLTKLGYCILVDNIPAEKILTSLIQFDILRILANKTENVFMVGDEDQSIYGFRAAYPEGLYRFSGIKTLSLPVLIQQGLLL